MLHHLVGGRWGFMIQRVLEAGIQTLPLMALFFIPLLFGLSDLYPWARTEVVAADPLLQQKAAYLNIPFFIARAVFISPCGSCWDACSSPGRCNRTAPPTIP